MKTLIKNISAIIMISLCASCGNAGPSKQEITQTVWDEYVSRQGGSASLTLKEAEVVSMGTIDPKLMAATAATKKQPTYLVRFKYNTLFPGLGDMDSDMYVLYILNTENSAVSMMWRGAAMLDDIKSEMAKYDFQSNSN